MVNEKKIDAVKNEVSPFRIADVAVIVALALLATVLMFTVYANGGEKVVITYDGKSAEYDLNIDREITIENKLTVCIKDGAVWVKDAECPDKICRKHGAIKKANETIVCAPQGITLRIVGKKGGNHVTTG